MIEGGGESKGIVGIIVVMVRIDGMVVGILENEVAGRGGSATFGAVGMVGKVGI